MKGENKNMYYYYFMYLFFYFCRLDPPYFSIVKHDIQLKVNDFFYFDVICKSSIQHLGTDSTILNVIV